MEDCEKEKKELQDRIKELKKSKNKNKRWRAEGANKYFYIDFYGNIESATDLGVYDDIYRYKTRNYFKTEEEAEEYQEIMNIYYDLMDLAEDLNNGEKIDWNNEFKCKYSIYYSYEVNTLRRQLNYKCKELGQIYCLDEDFLEKAIEKIGKNKLIKLFTYERS